jgi:hypothetical protein
MVLVQNEVEFISTGIPVNSCYLKGANGSVLGVSSFDYDSRQSTRMFVVVFQFVYDLAFVGQHDGCPEERGGRRAGGISTISHVPTQERQASFREGLRSVSLLRSAIKSASDYQHLHSTEGVWCMHMN